MLHERIVTYIKAVAPEARISFYANSFYVTGVDKTALSDIQYAVNEYMFPDVPDTRFEIREGIYDNGDIQMPNGLSLIDKSGIAFSVKVHKEVAPKLAENKDVIRYITASKMLWPRAKIYASRDVSIDEFDIKLLFDVNSLPNVSSEPVYHALCNIPEECSDENQVFTFLLRSDPVRGDFLDVTNLVEVLYG